MSSRESSSPMQELVRQHSCGGKLSSAESSPAGSQTEAVHRVLYSGYIEKKRVDSKLPSSKKWRRRYLELHPTMLVWIRESKDAKGYIFINAETELNETPPLAGHHGLIVITMPAEKRVLIFRCTSFEEHREWVNQIQTVINQFEERASGTPGTKLGRRKTGSFMVGSSKDRLGDSSFELGRDSAEKAGSTKGHRAGSLTSSSGGLGSMRCTEETLTEEQEYDEVTVAPSIDEESGDDTFGSEATGALCGSEVEARLLAIPGNSTCADCVTSDAVHHPNTPAWASTNLGCLFCIRCSGVHRKLGAHITKVLSIRIDSWAEAQLVAMERRGNDAVNAELEAEMPGNVEKPDLATSGMEELEAYIRAKYELGSFRRGGDGFVPHVRAQSTSCVGMVEFIGVLFIRLVEALDLPERVDGFCEFQLGDRSCRSKTVKSSTNPKWAESLSLNARSTNETLIVKMYDSSKLGGAAFLGQAVVALASLTHDGKPNPVELALQSTGKSAARLSRRSRATFTAPTISIELSYNALT